MVNWWSVVRGIPDLLDSVARLKSDVESCLKQPGIKAAWERFQKEPALREAWPRISTEWRNVEEAINRIKK